MKNIFAIHDRRADMFARMCSADWCVHV